MAKNGAKDTRTAMLEAAAKIFAAKGFHDATVRAICERWIFLRKFDIRMTFPFLRNVTLYNALRHGVLRLDNMKGTNR